MPDEAAQLERIAANWEKMLDSHVHKYVDLVPRSGIAIGAGRQVDQILGGIHALLYCANPHASAAEIGSLTGQLVETERARRKSV